LLAFSVVFWDRQRQLPGTYSHAYSRRVGTRRDEPGHAAKRFKVMANATMLIWKVLRVAESRWRKLDAPDLMKDVYEGREFSEGMPVTRAIGRKAA